MAGVQELALFDVHRAEEDLGEPLPQQHGGLGGQRACIAVVGIPEGVQGGAEEQQAEVVVDLQGNGTRAERCAIGGYCLGFELACAGAKITVCI